MLMINKFFALPFIIFIKFYQLIISPLLGSNCRYLPTCSEYAIESIKRFGLLKGFYFSIKRILKCHPWGGHGYDPISLKYGKNKNE